VIEEADDEGFTVAGRRLSYGEVERAKTVFEWGGQPKPGKAPRESGAARKPDQRMQTKEEAR
jgi:hypothetical protein